MLSLIQGAKWGYIASAGYRAAKQNGWISKEVDDILTTILILFFVAVIILALYAAYKNWYDENKHKM